MTQERTNRRKYERGKVKLKKGGSQRKKIVGAERVQIQRYSTAGKLDTCAGNYCTIFLLHAFYQKFRLKSRINLRLADFVT
jgi:hypothetical protein